MYVCILYPHMHLNEITITNYRWNCAYIYMYTDVRVYFYKCMYVWMDR